MTGYDERGFVYEELAAADVAGTLPALADQYAGVLVRPQVADAARIRPSPDVWSVLEYAYNVRDVLLILRGWVLLALVEDAPCYPPMCRDERVTLAATSGNQSTRWPGSWSWRPN